MRRERILRSTICFTVDWKDEPQGHFFTPGLPDTRRQAGFNALVHYETAGRGKEKSSASRPVVTFRRFLGPPLEERRLGQPVLTALSGLVTSRPFMGADRISQSRFSC